MFAAHHQLSNLHVIVDCNGQQALGLTRDVLNISNLAERWHAFGWRTSEVDGHSVSSLTQALSEQSSNAAPHIVIAKTVFGKGVSFMQEGIPVTQTHLPAHPVNWHYLPMSDHEYDLAIAELERPD
jgi:transketolase